MRKTALATPEIFLMDAARLARSPFGIARYPCRARRNTLDINQCAPSSAECLPGSGSTDCRCLRQ